MSKMKGVVKALKTGYKAGKSVRGTKASGPAVTGMAAGIGKHFGKHPKLAALEGAGIALPVGAALGSLGLGAKEAITGTEDGERRAMMLQMLLDDNNQELINREREQVYNENTRRLMQINPDLATRLMAGRKLPPGAVMFGAEPRSDLLREVAEAMAQGQFNPNEEVDPLTEFMNR